MKILKFCENLIAFDRMEAVLKVKHGGNPAFSFLLIDNPLQLYYQAILAHFKGNPDAALAPSLLPPEESESTLTEKEESQQNDATKRVSHSESSTESTGGRAMSPALSNSSAHRQHCPIRAQSMLRRPPRGKRFPQKKLLQRLAQTRPVMVREEQLMFQSSHPRT
jgi:hypothetical protein